jgi:small subunit ribosomal protein S8
MMTDPISDMLTRIRNAAMVSKHTVELPMSKVKFALAKVLETEGYLAGVERADGLKHPMLRLALKYDSGISKIESIKRISKPGRRVYVKAQELPYVRSGHGIAIISTPNGLMTSSEARKRRLGGEVICEIY